MFCCYRPLLGILLQPGLLLFWFSYDSSLLQNRTFPLSPRGILGKGSVIKQRHCEALRKEWGLVSVRIPDDWNEKTHCYLRECTLGTLPGWGLRADIIPQRHGAHAQTPNHPAVFSHSGTHCHAPLSCIFFIRCPNYLGCSLVYRLLRTHVCTQEKCFLNYLITKQLKYYKKKYLGYSGHVRLICVVFIYLFIKYMP